MLVQLARLLRQEPLGHNLQEALVRVALLVVLPTVDEVLDAIVELPEPRGQVSGAIRHVPHLIDVLVVLPPGHVGLDAVLPAYLVNRVPGTSPSAARVIFLFAFADTVDPRGPQVDHCLAPYGGTPNAAPNAVSCLDYFYRKDGLWARSLDDLGCRKAREACSHDKYLGFLTFLGLFLWLGRSIVDTL
jgi:hypothetical protein